MRACLLVLALSWTCFALDPKSLVKVGPAKVTQKADKIKIVVPLVIQKGFHIQAHEPGNPRFIPTTMQIEEKESGYAFSEVEYPKGKAFKIQVSPDPVYVYENKVELVVNGTKKQK